MTKNRTPTQVYLDPGMHSGLEVKGLKHLKLFLKPLTIIINQIILSGIFPEQFKKTHLQPNMRTFRKIIN